MITLTEDEFRKEWNVYDDKSGKSIWFHTAQEALCYFASRQAVSQYVTLEWMKDRERNKN